MHRVHHQSTNISDRLYIFELIIVTMTTDIKIRYINATSKVDFAVVVFTKNFSVSTPKMFYSAWQVLKGQSSVDFVYPISTSVGVTYEENGQIITSGPFPAELGTTWEITQELGKTADLKQSKSKLLISSLSKLYYFPLLTSHRG